MPEPRSGKWSNRKDLMESLRFEFIQVCHDDRNLISIRAFSTDPHAEYSTFKIPCVTLEDTCPCIDAKIRQTCCSSHNYGGQSKLIWILEFLRSSISFMIHIVFLIQWYKGIKCDIKNIKRNTRWYIIMHCLLKCLIIWLYMNNKEYLLSHSLDFYFLPTLIIISLPVPL